MNNLQENIIKIKSMMGLLKENHLIKFSTLKQRIHEELDYIIESLKEPGSLHAKYAIYPQDLFEIILSELNEFLYFNYFSDLNDEGEEYREIYEKLKELVYVEYKDKILNTFLYIIRRR